MIKNLVEIIKPAVHTDMNSYWAMHFCSIFETLYEQKNLQHSFMRPYMENVEPTLGNLAAKAGYAFFYQIKNSLQNFGLQSLLCHYLTSIEGKPVFDKIMYNASIMHDYDFAAEALEYGVFISGKDFVSGQRFIAENDPVLVGYDGLLHSEAAHKVAYADLCILIKNANNNLALLGEVEGNHGESLETKAFWANKNGVYYSFGIGVKSPPKAIVISGETFNQEPMISGKWVATQFGSKYVVLIESNHDVIADFHKAIGTIQMFMTLGAEQNLPYDPNTLPVIKLIKSSWNNHVLDLIQELRSLLQMNSAAVLGVNPMPAKVVPSIVV